MTTPGHSACRALAPAFLALACFSGTANSQTAPTSVGPQQVRSWAAACASCHGTDGRALPGAPVPGLAGRPAAYLTEKMQAFKTGKQDGTIMPQIAKGYSDEQIAQLSAYFAAVK